MTLVLAVVLSNLAPSTIAALDLRDHVEGHVAGQRAAGRGHGNVTGGRASGNGGSYERV